MRRSGRNKARAKKEDNVDEYVDDGSAHGSSENDLDADPEPSSDRAPNEPDDDDEGGIIEVDSPASGPEVDLAHDKSGGGSGRPYRFRKRGNVNYAIPPPLTMEETSDLVKPRSKGRKKGNNMPGWGASGADLGRFLGLPGPDDSVRPTFPLL